MSSRDPVHILPATYHTKRSAEGKSKDGKTQWYPTDKVPQKRRAPLPVEQKKSERKPTRLRKSITPGTVLIILAGQFIGRRVVFLKQLDKSGLLLVTGPYKVNGVPLRRVNQRYVIATSTKVDVSSIDVKSIDDTFFAAPQKPRAKAGQEFFAADKPKRERTEQQKDAQKRIDSAILPLIEKQDLLKSYLKAKFKLSHGTKPHLLKF